VEDPVDVDADVDAFDCLICGAIVAAAVDLEADETVQELADRIALLRLVILGITLVGARVLIGGRVLGARPRS
jgi:hypothetical protein